MALVEKDPAQKSQDNTSQDSEKSEDMNVNV